MGTRERLKRPKMQRTRPIRNWSAAVGNTRPPADATTGGAQGQASGEDIVGRAVELGYRVIDEYVRQGQRTARRLSDRSMDPGAIIGDMQELTSRIAQFATEWSGLWIDVAQSMAKGVGAMNPFGEQRPTPSEPMTAASRSRSTQPRTSESDEAARIRIDVDAARHIEVSMDIRPDATHRPLILHALRALDPALPRLTDLAFTPCVGDQPATLRLRVPAAQPAGTYSGVIVDAETNVPVGTLSVRVSES